MSKLVAVLVAVLLLLVAYILQRPTSFTFTMDVTIDHVDVDVVRQFVFSPMLLTSVHSNPSVVTSEERDTEGRTVGTIADTILLTVFGLFELPPFTITVPFVLTTRENEAHYHTSTPYIVISQTYSVSGRDGTVHVAHQFNGTCAWIVSFAAMENARRSHETMLMNLKKKLEENKL